MIDIEINGKRCQEMHAHGGASTQAFAYPPSSSIRPRVYAPSLQLNRRARKSRIVRTRQLYIIRIAKLEPDWVEVGRRTLPVVRRALGSQIQTQDIGYRIYVAADHDRTDFSLANIPEVFTEEL
jgi:hypothetical protein